MRRHDTDRSYLVKDKAASAVGDSRAMRRRPPCRNFGGDARSRELTGRITQTVRRIAGEQRELLRDIAELDRSEAWRGDGAISMTAWVTNHCRVSTSTARQWVTAAAHLESLPCLGEGLASGELSLDLVSSLAEVATAETDAELRRASAHWSVRQARELAAWHKAQQEASAPPGARNGRKPEATSKPDHENDEGTSPDLGTAAREFERRTLRFNDTRRTVWIAFTKDDYSVFKSTMVTRASVEKREADAANREARQHQEYVRYDQRLYDALDARDRPRRQAGQRSGHPSLSDGRRPAPTVGGRRRRIAAGLVTVGATAAAPDHPRSARALDRPRAGDRGGCG